MVGDGTYLTVGEAAGRLGVDPQTVRRYADAGKVTVAGVVYRLRSHRLPGSHRRIFAADVEAIRSAIFTDESTGGDPSAE